MQFQGQFGTDWGSVLAFVSLALVPTVGFYLLAERQIIAGVDGRRGQRPIVLALIF